MNAKNKQAQVQISEEELKKMLKKILNWKVPGSNGCQGLWLKYFTGLHKNPVYGTSMLAWKEKHYSG